MPAPPMTTDQYFRTPETLLPQELIYGYVREAAAAPTPGHQWWVGQLFIALTAELERQQTGRVWMSPIDVILDREKHLVVQPDLIVMSNERLHLVSDRVYGAPDLVVEVLSPHPRIGALHERLSWFAQYGVRECWLIEQMTYEVEVLQFAQQTVIERRMFRDEEPIQSVVLPGFDKSLEVIARRGR